MKFPTKANRPDEIPAYTKAGLGRVPETRLQAHDLPRLANLGEAWKALAPAVASQYLEMRSTNYETKVSPMLQEKLYQWSEEANHKFNPADYKENFTQKKRAYIDEKYQEFKSSPEFIDITETEVNQKLDKIVTTFKVDTLEDDFKLMADARRADAENTTLDAITFTMSSGKEMYKQDLRNGYSTLIMPHNTTSKVEGGRKVIYEVERDAQGNVVAEKATNRQFSGALGAIATTEEKAHQVNRKQFEAGVISYSTFLLNEQNIVRSARITIFQEQLNTANELFAAGDFDNAARLCSDLEQLIPMVETRVVYDSDVPGGVVVTAFDGTNISEEQYAEWDASIERDGKQRGVTAKTTRTSALTLDEQQKFMQQARLLKWQALTAKASALVQENVRLDPVIIDRELSKTPDQRIRENIGINEEEHQKYGSWE